MKKQSTEQASEEETDSSKVERQTLLPSKLEWFALWLCSCLFILVPLYYISLTAQGDWKETSPPLIESIARAIFSFPLQGIEGLIPVRTVNAEYKLAIFLAFASVVTGMILCGLHLRKKVLILPRSLLIFFGLFLGSVLVSSVFAHNFERAWASSMLWHFIPVLFAISLAQVNWNRKKIVFCLGSLLAGGIASCLITMDQHFKWTEWSWQLPLYSIYVPAGIIYNPNFAAEYHAPLLPIALGLLFYVRSIGIRIALGLTLAFVFLPALSLSLARGAWVGLIGGCIFGLTLFLVAWLFCQHKNSDESANVKSLTPLWGLLALGLALPVYVFTSHYWGDRVGLIGQCIFGLALFLVAWLSCRWKYSDESTNFKSFTPLWGLLALGLALPIYISDHWDAWVGLIGQCIFGLTFFGVAWLSCRRKNSDESANIKSFTPLWGLLALGLALPVYIFTSDHWKKGARIYTPAETGEEGSPKPSPPSPKAPSFETNALKSITKIEDVGSSRRLVLWQDALRASLNSDLLFGKGTDHYELHFHESAKLSDKTTGGTLVRFVHNDFIQTLYENGLLGLIGFLGIWVWILWKGVRSCLNQIWEGDLRGVGLRLGLVYGCLVFLIESFFEFPTRSPCSLMVGWTCLGVLLGILLREKGSTNGRIFALNPKLNLALGAVGVLVIPGGCLLAKDLFWTNVYHVQGRVAGDYQENDKSLKFHRKAIGYAPWEHHSRKFECYYLLTHLKRIPQAQDAIEETLRVHPGCLVAHQNKIALFLNTGRVLEARKAHLAMKKAAPFHPFTQKEGKKIEAQSQNRANNK